MKFLVIEPHSDDAVFAMGGTIAKYVSQGHRGAVFLVAASSVKFEHSESSINAMVRLVEHQDACSFLKVKSLSHGVFASRFHQPFDSDSILDRVPQREIIAHLEWAIDKWKPEILFCPGQSFHQDHRAVWQACMAAVRPTRKVFVDKVLLYELPTYFFNPRQYEFIPQVIEDVSEHIVTKVKAAALYKSQIRQESSQLSLRKIKEWAKTRGFQANCTYGEAFEVVRFVQR